MLYVYFETTGTVADLFCCTSLYGVHISHTDNNISQLLIGMMFTLIQPDGFEYKTNSCSSSTSDLNTISVPPSIQTVIRVIRTPGTALGISIAGGRGSVPFIGHDDVCKD